MVQPEHGYNAAARPAHVIGVVNLDDFQIDSVLEKTDLCPCLDFRILLCIATERAYM
jgi:hypothetical protein